MLTIEEKQGHRYALHHLGFRPFFLLASIFAVVSVIAWAWLYHSNTSLPGDHALPGNLWHSHEMIFAYGMAVVAGFLLTAVKNWTGIQTLNGPWLLALAMLWLLARCMPFISHPSAIMLMAILDVSFNLLLCLAIAHPIAKVRQWRQLVIWLCLVIMMLANLWFYTSWLGYSTGGLKSGLYVGLYTLLMLITLMGRRVIPFFIERGVDNGSFVKNWRPVDMAIITLMPVFFILDVFTNLTVLVSGLALVLALAHGARLTGWYLKGMFSKPMVWVLYLGYSWIVIGFALKGLGGLLSVNPSLALHAFSYGMIATVTLGMMSRVSLGHTGRDIYQPRPLLAVAFGLLLLGGFLRVLLPLAAPTLYPLWIGLAQGLWVASFAIFVWIYTPILLQARIDGRYG
ncbi:MAG: NnrS family protein [Proteobacteria bacterium]|nr:NnrS family protein [Pseudomonadota bacterium]